MEVILMERVEKLGQMGDVVKVKPGFARNFLLPQGKAKRATEANKAHFEAERAQLEAKNLERRGEAEAVAKKMNDVSVVLIRQAGDAGQLYGSVNARDISDALTKDGFTLGRSQIRLDTPIKMLGIHTVSVSLHAEVFVDVLVNVARSEDEAQVQAQTGRAALSSIEEEALAEAAARMADTEADEAVAEQAEAVFEEGAAPEADATGDAEEATAEDVTAEEENANT